MAVEEANLQFLPYMDCFPLKFNRSQIKTTFSGKSDFQSSHIFVRFSDSNRISVNLNKKFKSTLLYQLCPVFLQRLGVSFERDCSWTHTFCSILHIPILSRVSLLQCKTAAIDS